LIEWKIDMMRGGEERQSVGIYAECAGPVMAGVAEVTMMSFAKSV
jgi:hypothetical protein